MISFEISIKLFFELKNSQGFDYFLLHQVLKFLYFYFDYFFLQNFFSIIFLALQYSLRSILFCFKATEEGKKNICFGFRFLKIFIGNLT